VAAKVTQLAKQNRAIKQLYSDEATKCPVKTLSPTSLHITAWDFLQQQRY